MIEILYTCSLCGAIDRKVLVEERGDEDVKEWVDRTMTPALVKDHEEKSPGCRPSNFAAVKIPYTGREKVGGPVVQ